MEVDPFSKENLVHQQPLFKNVMFGDQKHQNVRMTGMISTFKLGLAIRSLI